MKTRRRATLADVAGRAGVSTTTASYILNGRSSQMRISRQTEERVRRAAHDLAYRPNRSARSLRTSRSATLGLISDHVASGHPAGKMLRGVAAAAREHDHLLLIGETEGDPGVESGLLEEMLDLHVDGLIYATVTTRQVRIPEHLWTQPAIVLLNCTDPASGLGAVLPDQHAGGRTAASTLLEADVAGTVLVVGDDTAPEVRAGGSRVDGVQAGLVDAGRPLGHLLRCACDVAPAYAALRAWLETGRTPSAVVCLDAKVAVGVHRALAEHGLRVPDDVSLVSFDGHEPVGWPGPRLTSVTMPYEQMGALAVGQLLEPARSQLGPGVLRVPMSLSPGETLRRETHQPEGR